MYVLCFNLGQLHAKTIFVNYYIHILTGNGVNSVRLFPRGALSHQKTEEKMVPHLVTRRPKGTRCSLITELCQSICVFITHLGLKCEIRKEIQKRKEVF